jgi:putative ATP-dependent endonuclease of the OLD family
MYISRLFIKNFRNFPFLDIPLQQGVNCFVGENNTGKTNLLHAVRLVLDWNMSAQRRRLLVEDFAAGVDFHSATHVVISVELTEITGKPNEEALVLGHGIGPDKARITYRFRPKRSVRDEIENGQKAENNLALDDYAWEMVGGAEGVDLAEVEWNDDFGFRVRIDELQQGFLVILMEALRDVEARLAQTRSSPLQQILDQREIPQAEQEGLVWGCPLG